MTQFRFFITVCCSNATCFYDNHSEHCYIFRSTPRDWKTAQNDCLQLGGHLAIAKDTALQTNLEELMTSQNVRTIWIGGQDLEGKTWQWVDGSFPFLALLKRNLVYVP